MDIALPRFRETPHATMKDHATCGQPFIHSLYYKYDASDDASDLALSLVIAGPVKPSLASQRVVA